MLANAVGNAFGRLGRLFEWILKSLADDSDPKLRPFLYYLGANLFAFATAFVIALVVARDVSGPVFWGSLSVTAAALLVPGMLCARRLTGSLRANPSVYRVAFIASIRESRAGTRWDAFKALCIERGSEHGLHVQQLARRVEGGSELALFYMLQPFAFSEIEKECRVAARRGVARNRLSDDAAIEEALRELVCAKPKQPEKRLTERIPAAEQAPVEN